MEASVFLRFTFANHRSIRDEVELSFVGAGENPYGRPYDGFDDLHVLPVAGLYGANASGKSSVLNAVAFMSSAVENSHRVWDPDASPPREPFALDPEWLRMPSLFEADVIVDGVRMAYGFQLHEVGVHHEWLYAWPNGRRQTLLERDGGDFTFGRNFPGEKSALVAFTRPNSLFLSAAVQNNHDYLLPLYRKLTSGISLPRTPSKDSLDTALEASIRALRDDRRARMIELVRVADLGIEDVIDRGAPAHGAQLGLFELPAVPVTPEEATDARRALSGFRRPRPTSQQSLLADERARDASGRTERLAQSAAILQRYRRREVYKPSDIEFLHAGRVTARLGVGQESAGTLSWFALAGQLLDVSGTGGLLCFDELDATLHPVLVAEVVRMFQEVRTNPRGAQLLAACHDTTILAPSTEAHLLRDQVWLTEKSDEGATTLTPLSDYAPRSGQNLELGYRNGRFGALPMVDAMDLASALAPLEEAG